MLNADCRKEGPRRVFVREELCALTGDAIAAAILDILERGHYQMLSIAQARYGCDVWLSSVLQPFSVATMVETLLGLGGRHKVKAALDYLVSIEAISAHKNPNPRWAFDRTRHYLYHTNQVIGWLNGEVEAPPKFCANSQKLYRQHADQVFERDDFCCVYCGSESHLSIDHVIPQSRGGSHEPENLVTCCRSCNSSKGARTPQEWLQAQEK